MALRTGLSFPVGEASGAPQDALGARYAWQVPLALDIGAKIGPSIFVGVFFHIGFGGEGSDTLVEALCNDDDEDLENDVSCSVITLRLGLEAQYHFMPAERLNPWLGYGAGFESASQTIRDTAHGYAETHTASGLTYAQIGGGFDFRSKVFGAGPYAEVALGRFAKSTTEVDGIETDSGDITDSAWHAWVSLGLRMVLFP